MPVKLNIYHRIYLTITETKLFLLIPRNLSHKRQSVTTLLRQIVKSFSYFHWSSRWLCEKGSL